MSAEDRQPVIVYDGDCPFCRDQIARIQRRDTRDSFEYVPRQQPGLTDRFPALTDADFNTGMRLIEPDATIHVGADAVYQIARRVPAWRIPAQLYRVPGLRRLFRFAYRWVARNRQRLGSSCDNGACTVQSASSPETESTASDSN